MCKECKLALDDRLAPAWIEDVTRKTWNKHTEDLVPNALLHIQAEDAMAVETNTLMTLSNLEKETFCLAGSLPKPNNSVFSKEFIMAGTPIQDW